MAINGEGQPFGDRCFLEGKSVGGLKCKLFVPADGVKTQWGKLVSLRFDELAEELVKDKCEHCFYESGSCEGNCVNGVKMWLQTSSEEER